MAKSVKKRESALNQVADQAGKAIGLIESMMELGKDSDNDSQEEEEDDQPKPALNNPY